MVKMKTSTTCDMCTLFCGLIICTLVSTARTTNTTTTADPVIPEFDSSEEDLKWTSTHLPETITIAKYGSKTTLGTPSVTDTNDLKYGNKSVVNDVIDNSTKTGNDYHPSDKDYSSTEPIPANKDTQSKPKKQVITVVTMRSKNKCPLLDPISSILVNKKPPTRYYKPAEWIKPTNNCKCVFGKKYLKYCNNNEKETTTTKIWGRSAEYNHWQQQRHMIETTTSNHVKGQLEESEKWKLRQRELEMESNRFHTILDVSNSRKYRRWSYRTRTTSGVAHYRYRQTAYISFTRSS